MIGRVRVATIGELLAEFVCSQPDLRHIQPAAYWGPFPSGAPAIFIDQSALLGATTCLVGGVGSDPFGAVITNVLADHGVGTKLIRKDPDTPTGTAFVSYGSDGSREFVFNIDRSAATQLFSRETIVEGLTAFAPDVLHVSGSTLSVPRLSGDVIEICRHFHRSGAKISLDPNVRPELLGNSGYQGAIRTLIGMCTYFLPSDHDLASLYPGRSIEECAGAIFDDGATYFVLKKGADGCRLLSAAGGDHSVAGHAVNVVDATGAGDCFAASFVTLVQSGSYDLATALSHANAAGAMAVTKMGPMSGNSTLEEIETFLGVYA